MLGFFQGVWEVIANLIEFFSQTMRSILQICNIVQSVIFFPAEIANYVPAFLLTSIYVVIIIGIIKLLLGRENR